MIYPVWQVAYGLFAPSCEGGCLPGLLRSPIFAKILALVVKLHFSRFVLCCNLHPCFPVCVCVRACVLISIFQLNKVIFVWYHCDGAEPTYTVEEVEEVNNGLWRCDGFSEHMINAHIQVMLHTDD